MVDNRSPEVRRFDQIYEEAINGDDCMLYMLDARKRRSHVTSHNVSIAKSTTSHSEEMHTLFT